MGKTTVARAIAADLHAACVGIDDHIPRDVATASPFHDDAVWNSEPPALLAALRTHTALLAPIVTDLIADARSRHVVIEGEGIEPRLAAPMASDDLRAVFVIEDSVDRLRATLHARDSPGGHRYRELPDAAQRAIATMNADYGRWICAEAEAARLPPVSAQPWSTLAARVATAISGRSGGRSVPFADGA